MKKICYGSFLLFFLTSCQTSKEIIPLPKIVLQETPSELELLVDEIRETYKIPCLAAAIIRSDSIEEITVSGYRNILTKEKAKEVDKFHLGSNTKAFTSILAALLIKQNKLRWSTKLLDIFPEFKSNSRAVYQSITLQDLLSHQARIQPFTDGLEFKMLPKFEGNPQEQRKAFSFWLVQQKPMEIDSTCSYTYSNAGYTIAAAMLENVTGQSWEELVKINICVPLGISCNFGWPENIEGHIRPIEWAYNEGRELIPLPIDLDYKLDSLIVPSGDLTLSLKDYARFVQEQLKGFRGQSVLELNYEDYEKLHFGINDYALGWGNKKEEYISFHDGSAGTFYSHTSIHKNHDLAITILANAGNAETVKGVYVLKDVLNERLGI